MQRTKKLGVVCYIPVIVIITPSAESLAGEDEFISHCTDAIGYVIKQHGAVTLAPIASTGLGEMLSTSAQFVIYRLHRLYVLLDT